MATSTAAMSVPSRRKSTVATPAMQTKTGAPSRNAAASSSSRSPVAMWPGAASASSSAASASSSAAARSPQRSAARSWCAPARQAKRSAIPAKPTGITSMLQAILNPEGHLAEARPLVLDHRHRGQREDRAGGRRQRLAEERGSLPRRTGREGLQGGERQVTARDGRQERPRKPTQSVMCWASWDAPSEIPPREAAHHRGGRDEDQGEEQDGDQPALDRGPLALTLCGCRRAHAFGALEQVD
ncbi:MAG: hypothetical protein QM767_06450 [Anaeromyxobacter sp.]